MTPDQLDGLLEGLRLKDLARAGWVRRGVPTPESVAAHSWGLSYLVLLFLPEDLSLERAMAYAALHDLAEARVGDLTPHDGVTGPEKRRLEHDAMRALCLLVPRGPQILDRWERYESLADAEARFVRELDRLDMALQAVVYGDRGHAGMHEFLDSAARVIEHPALTPVLAACRARLAQGSSTPDAATEASTSP